MKYTVKYTTFCLFIKIYAIHSYQSTFSHSWVTNSSHIMLNLLFVLWIKCLRWFLNKGELLIFYNNLLEIVLIWHFLDSLAIFCKFLPFYYCSASTLVRISGLWCRSRLFWANWSGFCSKVRIFRQFNGKKT